jgi:hypothetical protein
MRAFSVLLLGAFCCVHIANSKAASPTYLDLAPRDAWRYFYSDGTAAESDTIIDTALQDTGFYDNWTLPDFDEPDVLSITWQDGSVPIGFGSPVDRFDDGTLLDTPLSDRNRTLFLRQTFEVPPEIERPFAIDLSAVGATIYLDGAELIRDNCCETDDGQPTIGRPGLLDRAESAGTVGLYILESLSAGQHTVAVSAHPSRPRSTSQFLDLRLFAPISEKPWKGSEDSDWFTDGNWYFGTPEPGDFAVFRRENRDSAQLDASITLSGIQFDSPTWTGHVISGAGEIGLQGAAGSSAGFNATEGNHRLFVDVSMGSDVDATIESDSIIIEGRLNLNGHTLNKHGDGSLIVMSHNESESGTIFVDSGTLAGTGTIAGNVTTSNGVINPGYRLGRTLTVTGDVTGRVELDLSSVDRFDVLAGNHSGVADIEHLKIGPDGLDTYDGATFQLFVDWPALSIDEMELPDIGTAQWDTSRLQEGILSVSHSNPNPCDLNASGFCNVADLDLLATDIVEGNNDPRFDMNADNLVDQQDVDIWLLDAALVNGFESAYLSGDADLNGSVNAADLMTLGLHWRQSVTGWSRADFIMDGEINAQDLNAIAMNWQKTISRRPAAVPEPMSFLLMFFALPLFFQLTRRLKGRLLATLVITMSLFVSLITR